MQTYYLQPGQRAHVYQRPRAYSQSYQHTPQQMVYTHSAGSHHSSPRYAYPQQASQYAAPQYLTPNYQYDAGRHHHQGHARSGSGGVMYTSSAPSHHHGTSRRSPSSSPRHSGERRSTSHSRHHRSHSVPRPSVQVVDARTHHHRSSSRPRQSPPHQTLHRDRRPSTIGEPLSERIRRMFGFGGHSRTQHRDYVDARSGRTVDWRGRPIYRV
ncbi:hypothetical protein C8Q78DRAFT_987393 [Trametes maxima]|nr:hypothetical protein C8Q78DRAFT_987393 [Trametes maxima]